MARRPCRPAIIGTITNVNRGHARRICCKAPNIRARSASRRFAPGLRAVSVAAGARRADGRPLVLLPHDCRRVFASEHLNNNVPVHVIQALLGHATLDTVMVYAKLYPTTLIEEYRKAVRGLYNAFHGDDSLRNPDRG